MDSFLRDDSYLRDITGDKPEEACGIVGINAPGRDVSRMAFFSLFALQHRGQESAGIAVSDNGHLTVFKDMGLVSQVFKEETLKSLSGQAAIGHVRYSTTGSARWVNAQPVCHHSNGHTLALAHNGNLVNTAELREELERQGVNKFNSTSDSELLAALIAANPAQDIRDAVAATIPMIRGAFSVVLLSQGTVIGFRDPWGVRPLCVGKLEGHYVIASESCGLDIIGAEFLREVKPGEMVVLGDDDIEFRQVVPAAGEQGLCIFEFIYFARPDSVIEGNTISKVRNLMGAQLAREYPVEADMVIPVPDTGTPAAIGFARESGIPYGEGLIKNRYIGRTFIQPDQNLRQHGIRIKLNPLAELIRGKRLVVVDDSIVRGNTTHKIVRMLFDAGASEVHLRISSPPITHPCFYGIDTATSTELVAATKSVADIRSHVGATSLEYLSLEGLQEAVELPAERFCRACFNGEYPVEVPAEVKMSKHRFEQVEKVCP